MAVDALSVPEVPVTVTLAAPVTAVLSALNVRTLLPVAGFVARTAVTPFGRPVKARITFPANEPASIIDTLLVPLLP